MLFELKNFLGRGLILGVTIVILLQLLLTLKLSIWATFVATLVCFILGGAPKDMIRVAIACTGGVIWGMVMVKLIGFMPAFTGDLRVPIAIGIACVPIFLLEKVPFADFLPGYFAGCAVYFGLNTTFAITGKAFIFSVAPLYAGCIYTYILIILIVKYMKMITPAEPASNQA